MIYGIVKTTKRTQTVVTCFQPDTENASKTSKETPINREIMSVFRYPNDYYIWMFNGITDTIQIAVFYGKISNLNGFFRFLDQFASFAVSTTAAHTQTQVSSTGANENHTHNTVIYNGVHVQVRQFCDNHAPKTHPTTVAVRTPIKNRVTKYKPTHAIKGYSVFESDIGYDLEYLYKFLTNTFRDVDVHRTARVATANRTVEHHRKVSFNCVAVAKTATDYTDTSYR